MSDRSPGSRASELLAQMSLDEKIAQVCAEMIFDIDEDYERRRDPLLGHYRNPGHFMHHGRPEPASPAEVTEQIGKDVARSIEAQPHGIPPIENGEALHGAQWGMATCFPQPIGMASSFDPELMDRVADAIGKECAAVGVRQVFAPVVNVARDCRWGRTVETFGEDALLCGDMGAAMCRGLEKNGVIATPKHFVDNYAAGGRDSNYSDTSERTMREIFLPPFKACFDAGAQSVMAAYNAWEGVPCTANRRLLTDILRGEWGFGGFVVSDYSGANGMYTAHRWAHSEPDAAAKALKAGLDVLLPFRYVDEVKAALAQGLLTEEDLDRNVLRILTAKFRIGLFDAPYRDPAEAQALVRCEAHKKLALEAAREAIVLLKNDGVLPFDKTGIRTVGVFGQNADLIPVGSNYSGPYAYPWTGEDAPTPLEALRDYLGDGVRVVFGDSEKIPTLAPQCDVCLYLTSLVEGEGSDRSDLRLPSVTVHRNREDDSGLIVDVAEQTVKDDQERAIINMCHANPNSAVILLNGAPVDMTAWIDAAGAVVEAWYPGEQGARALTEILFGETCPSAKLPIGFPKNAGQLPLPYSFKPSGRGYAYCDNDGKPRYPFGHGLSYTSFEIAGARMDLRDGCVEISCSVKNTGGCDGAEVVQLYLGSHDCEVVMPIKRLAAYTRVFVPKGGTKKAVLRLDRGAFAYYNMDMAYGLHDGAHTLMLGTSSEQIAARFELVVRGGVLTAG